MKDAKLNVVHFGESDVIATSCYSATFESTSGSGTNATKVTYNGTVYTGSQDFYNAFNINNGFYTEAYGASNPWPTDRSGIADGTDTISGLNGYTFSTAWTNKKLNGTYTWSGDVWSKQ